MQKAVPRVLRQVWEQPKLSPAHSSRSSQEWPSLANWVPGRSSQLHSYPPWVLRHEPWHGPCPLRSRHSLWSMHFLPLDANRKPEEQEHWYDPCLLVHWPSQPPLSTKHSSTSVDNQMNQWGRTGKKILASIQSKWYQCNQVDIKKVPRKLLSKFEFHEWWQYHQTWLGDCNWKTTQSTVNCSIREKSSDSDNSTEMALVEIVIWISGEMGQLLE